MPTPPPTPTRRHALLLLLVAGWNLGLAGCRALVVRGQRVPSRALAADPAAFVAGPDVAVLHYYGVGGWSVSWRGQVLLFAPYFSHHPLPKMFPGTSVTPELDEIRAGLAGTPAARAAALVVGHGHVDHAGDLRAYVEAGLVGRPALVADRSVVNMFDAIRGRFACVVPLAYDEIVHEVRGCLPASIRITAIHSGHAPHVGDKEASLTMYGGVVTQPQRSPPARVGDYKVGYVWAYLVDLLDEAGKVQFRIHYMDAAASPPHAFVPAARLAERDVDVEILCAPGFDLVDDYPYGLLRRHRARHVMIGHWEDFFSPRRGDLDAVTVLDEAKLDAFVTAIDDALGAGARLVTPTNKGPDRCTAARPCGPRAPTWTLPVPGETFHFAAGPQPPAPPLPAEKLAPDR
jgi:hypothetical protein